MGLKEWNLNFRLEHSDRGRQNQLFRCSIASGNFPLERGPEKSRSIYFPTGFFGTFFKW